VNDMKGKATMSDISVDVYPWEPDDHGGGFPFISVDATIYTEKDLDKLITVLLKKRTLLRRQLKKACMETT